MALSFDANRPAPLRIDSGTIGFMDTNRTPRQGVNLPGSSVRPPESIERAALTIEEAAGLMSELGFIAFRTPPAAPGTDSCLMVMIRDAPTRRHFDPESVGYWVLENGHGQIRVTDRGTTTPISHPYSWGPIRVIDRFGARNSFATFGGWLSGERVGDDALLLIFRSSAPILRLRGHSQQRDRLSDAVVAFFSRLVPQMWSHPERERLVSSAAPQALYAAFLLHAARRAESSTTLREASADDASVLARELNRIERMQPGTLGAGGELLSELKLGSVTAV
jgi:hypothetical protein